MFETMLASGANRKIFFVVEKVALLVELLNPLQAEQPNGDGCEAEGETREPKRVDCLVARRWRHEWLAFDIWQWRALVDLLDELGEQDDRQGRRIFLELLLRLDNEACGHRGQ